MKKHPNTIAYLRQMKSVLDIEGSIAECGVYKGDNTFHYAMLLKNNSSCKKLFAFDTFKGFPKDSKDNVNLTRFDDSSLKEVEKLLSGFANVIIHAGLFEDTLPLVESESFCCVILDCDLYESYVTCLNFFYPRMTCGGIIILDEYYSHKYPLAKVAVDEFCDGVTDKPEMFYKEKNGWERWMIKKS
jgi:O-methyltransferase